MKRTLTLLLAFIAVAIVATSCTKKYEQVTPNQTILTSIPANAWVKSSDGSRYFATIKMPEIDSYVNQNNAILVYGNFEGNIWEQIPETYNGVAYSFSHTVGSIEVDIQTPNGSATSITPPSKAVNIKIVIVDSY